MDARPTFTGFGIDREHSRYHHASPDDAPILDGFFKKMLDELYDGVYFVNSERRILYWNAAAERLSGYTAAEVVGSLCFDNILDHTEAEGCHLCHERCPLAATMQSRKQLCKRVFLKHKEGNRIAVEVRVSPVMDAPFAPVDMTGSWVGYEDGPSSGNPGRGLRVDAGRCPG